LRSWAQLFRLEPGLNELGLAPMDLAEASRPRSAIKNLRMGVEVFKHMVPDLNANV